MDGARTMFAEGCDGDVVVVGRDSASSFQDESSEFRRIREKKNKKEDGNPSGTYRPTCGC